MPLFGALSTMLATVEQLRVDFDEIVTNVTIRGAGAFTLLQGQGAPD